MSSSSDEKTKQEVLVLYGSQTGNSEQAAIEISDKIPNELGSNFIGRHMQLDDFLEIEKAKWTPLVVIVTSSYGVGAAPLGCYRFRAFCDYILENCNENEKEEDDEKKGVSQLLKGISFAMLGLGDSGYTTFFENPKTVHAGMIKAGAHFIGDLGKADADGSGENAQDLVIRRWIDGIWPLLKEAVNNSDLYKSITSERLEEIQRNTSFICEDVLEKVQDEDDEASIKKSGGNNNLIFIGVIGIIIALLAFYLNNA